MEESLTNGMPLGVTRLLQHTLTNLCVHENSLWVYAVFWRILPRNYPPPKWDLRGGPHERTRGNRRHWILVWEDGFCNFSASSTTTAPRFGGGFLDTTTNTATSGEPRQTITGLQPELFFKMSHEIYNFGEGIIGKVAADYGHKYIFKEPNDNILSEWQNPVDSHPRTWEAQFRSGVQTIALVAVREGVLHLGSLNKVMEDMNYIMMLRRKFSYIGSIPGVLLPHPSSAGLPINNEVSAFKQENSWSPPQNPGILVPAHAASDQYADYLTRAGPQLNITPSMTSLEALLSKLPSVELPVSSSTAPATSLCGASPQYVVSHSSTGKGKVEEDDHYFAHSASYRQHVTGGNRAPMCSFHQE